MARQKRIELVQAAQHGMSATDSMADAGRKVMLGAFLTFLNEENEFRSGDPVKGVHQMRVATRRMRSALRVLSTYYPKREVRTHRAWLKATATVLGRARDLDVMIGDLTAFSEKLDEARQAGLAELIAHFTPQQEEARVALVDWLESRNYRRGIKDFTRFLIPEPGKSENEAAETMSESAAEATPDLDPHQVRLVIPIILYQHLGAVRAFDGVIAQASLEMLHALRIEFKRLRYILSFFEPVLGQTAGEFIKEIKQIQDTLGTINDARVAAQALSGLDDLSENAQAVRSEYLAYREEDARERQAHFVEVWEQFNSRSVQRKLSDALLALR